MYFTRLPLPVVEYLEILVTVLPLLSLKVLQPTPSLRMDRGCSYSNVRSDVTHTRMRIVIHVLDLHRALTSTSALFHHEDYPYDCVVCTGLFCIGPLH